MTEKEKMLSGRLYLASDPELAAARERALGLTYRFNQLLPWETEEQQRILRELLGRIGTTFQINQPFRCDYGCNIQIGENFYCNYNCTILDVAPVTIGDNVLFAPNVSLFTAGHPLDAELRNTGLEYGFPITIGDNVWVGGNVTVCPQVTIGDGAVIGAGSVVTRDIPANVVAAGNPCRVLRPVADRDRTYYFQDRPVEP